MARILGTISSGFTEVGSFESIASQTVGSGGTSTITFSSIPQTYGHLQLRGYARCNEATTWTNLGIRFNNDSGTNYTTSRFLGNGTSLISEYDSTTTSITGIATFGTSFASSAFAGNILDIYDYTTTSKRKVIRGFNSANFATNNSVVRITSGVWTSTSSITQIDIIPISPATSISEFSHFELYGIRTS